MTDVEGNTLDSTGYTLAYQIAGPIATVIALTATASGTGWTTTLDATNSAKLVEGKFWWQAVLTATNFRLVVGSGELTVLPDLAALTAQYDGRTVAETALADAEAAYSNFVMSGGLVKDYTIGNRRMQFQTASELKDCVEYWRSRVMRERSAANGGKGRRLLARFQRAT
jgi:hypothetical protein